MPSTTFYNLPKKKQDKLITAAKMEFTKLPFHKVSINSIIEHAEIPRGSFYMYFTDKEDIFKYILESYKDDFKDIVKLSFENNDGDLKKSFIDVFENVYNYVNSKQNKKFFKNVFFDMTLKSQKFLVPLKNECKRKNINLIKNMINLKYLNLSSTEEIYDAFEFMMNLTMTSIINSLLLELPYEKACKSYIRKVNIICNGIYKKGEKYAKSV